MKFKALGTGNAFNQESRLNSSYLMEVNNQNVLIDCGFTVPFALQKSGVEFSSIDTILITHYHGDHYAGLAAILLGLKYTSRQYKKLTIVGAGDVKTKVFELLKVLYEGSEKLVNELDINFVSVNQLGGSYELNGFEIEVAPMVHSEAAIPVGYILKEKGNRVGFTGDTCWHEGLKGFINSCTSLIIECNFSERVGEGHLSVEELNASKEIQEIKSEVYLTHLYEVSAKLALENGYQVLTDGTELVF